MMPALGERRRRVYIFATLLCLFSLQLADAQRIRFRSSGLVTFTPTREIYLASFGGTVQPEPSSPNIRMRVNDAQQYTFRIEPTGRPNGAPPLQARYTFSNGNGGTAVTGWLPLDGALQGTISNGDNRTDISVEYRVRLTGQEVAGTYTTSLIYRANNSSVSHDVSVTVPNVTALRVDTSLVTAQSATLYFDYGGDKILTYLNATETLSPLPTTGSDIRVIEVFSNNPEGYAVTLSVLAEDGLSSPLTDNLYLLGQPAEGRRFRSSSPTYGFQALASPDDFSLFVDGLEDPGEYTFRVLYEAEPNP